MKRSGSITTTNADYCQCVENLTANGPAPIEWHSGTAVLAAFQAVANGERWTKNEYALGRKLKAVAGRLAGLAD